ncbi:MAG: hypothetical protein GX318_02550 [Clostridia bacterium]|nr:hypothetical protein [Clostridia bacterium]
MGDAKRILDINDVSEKSENIKDPSLEYLFLDHKIDKLLLEIRSEIADLRRELRKDIADLKQEIRSEIRGLR